MPAAAARLRACAQRAVAADALLRHALTAPACTTACPQSRSNEHLPQRVKDDTAFLDFVPADPNIAKDTPLIAADGTQLLPRGVTSGDVRTLLAPLASRRHLRFRSMPPGAEAFGGFDDAAEGAAFAEHLKQAPAMWCCIDERAAKARGQPFPPGQTWYDLQWDVVPHTDRFNRRWDGPWTIKLGP